MHRIALAALATISSIGTAQAATTIGFQPLANVSGTAVPVTYVESGYTIQSNNTREPVPGVIQNSTLSLQKLIGPNGSGIPAVNFARSTSFSLTGGTFTFGGLAAYFGSTNGISNSFAVVGSLLDQQLYAMTFTATGGTVQPSNVFRTFESGSNLVFDKLVFTAGGNTGTVSIDDIRVSAASIPTPTPVVPPVAAAVPEPGTWAMMTIGFGLVGGTMRRRRGQMSARFA